MKFLSFFLVLFLFFCVSNAFYSISFYSNNKGDLIHSHTFTTMPSPLQVADIYARLSDIAPITIEKDINLPTVEYFEKLDQLPLLLEVHGGILPAESNIVVHATRGQTDQEAPLVKNVLEVLKNNGIDAEAKVVNAYSSNFDLVSFMQSEKRPIVILHHHNVPSVEVNRRLDDSSPTPLTEFEISQYQICLWSGLGIFLIITFAIYSVANMEVIPDSLLYAKFQSGRTDKRD